MPVMACAGTSGCGRMISVSAIRGGNPSAKADPEGFAGEWTQCGACRAFTCDRCLAKQGDRCACGTPAALFTEDQRIDVALRMMGVGGPPGPTPPGAMAVARVSPPGPTAPKPAAPAVRHEPWQLVLPAIALGVAGALVGAWAAGALGAVIGCVLGLVVGSLGARR